LDFDEKALGEPIPPKHRVLINKFSIGFFGKTIDKNIDIL
jgi:hypothetical protein